MNILFETRLQIYFYTVKTVSEPSILECFLFKILFFIQLACLPVLLRLLEIFFLIFFCLQIIEDHRTEGLLCVGVLFKYIRSHLNGGFIPFLGLSLSQML